MKSHTSPEAINLVYLRVGSYLELDKSLRAFIGMSAESMDYAFDDITSVVPPIGPLHFDFIPHPIFLWYSTGVIIWEAMIEPLLQQGHKILIDLGLYITHAEITNSFPDNHLFLVGAAKKFQKPTVYMVQGSQKEINMDALRSKSRLNELDPLMAYDLSDLNSLKAILHKLMSMP